MLRAVALAGLLLAGPLGGLCLPAHAATQRILSGLREPVFVGAPVGDERLFVLERRGVVSIYRDGALLDPPFLDIRPVVNDRGEGGLLSIAFPEDFSASRAFYVYYTVDGPVGFPLTSRVSRFRVRRDDPDRAAADQKVLLELDQPNDNHNGGTIAFGADDLLYIGFGDGGGANDPAEAAQRGDTWLGKLLRLDVSFDAFSDDYTVPPDNPFVGDPQVLDEIWALGFRNPYRFSFDRETGDLYAGDVGQNRIEEIDAEPRPDPGAGNPGGRNYGWDVKEGSECFEAPDPGEPACSDPSLVDPIYEYRRGSGSCSVTGGVVYRGSLPGLVGDYLFADFCSARIWGLVWDGGSGIVGDVIDWTPVLEPDVGFIGAPVAIGEDGAGEVYIVDFGLIGGSSGEVYKIVPEPASTLLVATGTLVLGAFARRRLR
jgi:glucose/arabinose dehydrogenase